MKKILLMLLAISLVATLFAGCGEEAAPEASGNGDPAIDATLPEEEVSDEVVDGTPTTEPTDEKEDDVAAVPEAETDTAKPSKPETTQPPKTTTEPSKPDATPSAPATKPEEKPADKPAVTPEKPADKPAGEDAPASKPEDKPVAKEYSINEVHTIIKNTYGEDYRPNVEIPRESLTDLFGINLDDVEEFIAEQPMISANIDTFIAIKAKSGKGQTVASALNAYKDSLLNGAMMYPSNMPKAQAAKVVSHGDYVFLVMLGAAGDMEADEETQLTFAKAQVEKGTNAINNYFTK